MLTKKEVLLPPLIFRSLRKAQSCQFFWEDRPGIGCRKVLDTGVLLEHS